MMKSKSIFSIIWQLQSANPFVVRTCSANPMILLLSSAYFHSHKTNIYLRLVHFSISSQDLFLIQIFSFTSFHSYENLVLGMKWEGGWFFSFENWPLQNFQTRAHPMLSSKCTNMHVSCRCEKFMGSLTLLKDAMRDMRGYHDL
jgi:hypothetical protein